MVLQSIFYGMQKVHEYSCKILQNSIVQEVVKDFPRIDLAKKVADSYCVIFSNIMKLDGVGERGKRILESCTNNVKHSNFQIAMRIALILFGFLEGAPRLGSGVLSLATFDVKKGLVNIFAGSVIVVIGLSELLSCYDSYVATCQPNTQDQRQG